MFQDKYRIKSTRLANWVYSLDGFYYATICVNDRRECFGRVQNGKMILSSIGQIAYECW